MRKDAQNYDNYRRFFVLFFGVTATGIAAGFFVLFFGVIFFFFIEALLGARLRVREHWSAAGKRMSREGHYGGEP
jgi:Flp pilus assembly protein TadB